MPKNAHPVEAFERSIIDRASYFTAFVQIAPGDRRSAEFEDQAQAEAAARLAAAHFGKAILVYAVTAEGRSALAATIHPQPKDRNMTPQAEASALSLASRAVRGQLSPEERENGYSARSAAVRAAKSALGADAKVGEHFEVSERGGRHHWKSTAKADAEAERSFAAPEAEAPVKERPAPQPKSSGGGSRPPRKPPAPPTGMPRMRKSTAEAFANATKGILPEAPDFTAETHKRFRPKLDELKALVAAKDVKGLKAYPINPISTSPKALDRYRNLAVTALEAQATSGEVL